MDAVLKWIITSLPTVFGWIVFAGALAWHFLRSRSALSERFGRYLSVRNLIVAAIGFSVAYAAFMTVAQYVAWSGNAFSRVFLTLPLSPDLPIGAVERLPWLFSSSLGYFIFYSWGRFWLGMLLSVGAAWVWWRILRVLRWKNEWFFEEGEPELGFVVALIVGWPKFVLFVPLVFVAVVLVSAFRLIVFKKRYTTLGFPFLVAGLLTLAFGPSLLTTLGLMVLKV
ncbi:MAG: hypothetical protein AAB601_00600 [Patescibacteria group bacterium]